ncbi:MAG: TlyA family RNA methyltransferase [Hyphomicrobiales bacterium]|nr:TlyA family RNA methyltransferase [Hyphomicrobiales bacterium]
MLNKIRLDQHLVELDHYPSRARARDAILRGTITVDGQTASKPGQTVNPAAHIEIADDAQMYVSRAALKLIHGLEHFEIDVKGLHALDLGASTGGFTQVLLENGVASVHAIDVGHGQLADELREDGRVIAIEGLNARNLTADHLEGPVNLIVCDVSFISLKLALPAALALAEPGTHLIALIKPQFEIGRDKLGKGGVVRDRFLATAICDVISNWLEADQHWQVLGITPSPIAGGDGNHEFLIAARKPGV